MEKNTKLRYILNIVLAVSVFGAWLAMVFKGVGPLTGMGFRSLRYFTTLSNLLAATAAVIWMVTAKKRPIWIERLKFVAATAVSLTFTVVIAFLGFIYGYASMYAGANFWLHLVGPVLAVAEVIFLSDASFSKKDALISVIPTILYGAFYVGNILINGMGGWPNTNDWYGFMSWGIPMGFAIYVFISFVTWLLARLIRFLSGKRTGAERLSRASKIS